MMIGGVGVGLTIPSLTAMVAATLPPERLATGIAVQVTGRQLGSALGAAILVAVVGAASTAADFAGAWRFMLAASLLAGLTLSLARRAPAAAGRTPASSASGSTAMLALASKLELSEMDLP
jgi:MFS family permease